MEEKKKKEVDRDPPINIRQRIIFDLIKNDTSIMSITELIEKMKRTLNDRYPNKYPNAEFEQPLISRDFRTLDIKARGRNKGFYFTNDAIEKHNTQEIKAVFKFAKINESDIVKSMYPLIVKVEGYSQAISVILKKMYPESIIETICLETSLIIFCKSDKGRNEINNKLISLSSKIFD